MAISVTLVLVHYLRRHLCRIVSMLQFSSMQVQVEILKRFKAGELNALVATAVAEEGLDITHCSLIVRWTLPATTRQFIQSRGRARAPGSSMVSCCPDHSPCFTMII